MNKIVIFILFWGMIFACNKQSDLDSAVESTSLSEKEVMNNSSFRSVSVQNEDFFNPPSGWYKVDEDKGVALFKSNDLNVYVTVLDLSMGAQLRSYFQYKGNVTKATEKNPSPTFIASPVASLEEKIVPYGWFTVCNLSFFGNGYQSAHILKKDNVLVSCGYAGYDEKGFSKRFLSIYSDYATIQDGPPVPRMSLKGKGLYRESSRFYSASNVMGGLFPLTKDSELNPLPNFGANKRSSDKIGRTMLGLRSSKGKKSIVYVLVAEALTQDEAYMLLRDTFQTEQVIMFDGSGSSQLRTRKSLHYLSGDGRKVATYLIVKPAS